MSNYDEEEFQHSSFDKSVWKKIFNLLKPFKKHVVLLFVINIVMSSIDVLFPVLNRQAIDYYVLDHVTNNEIIQFSLIYFGFVVVQSFVVYAFFYVVGKIEMGVGYNVRKICFEKLQLLPYTYFDKTPIGWLMARMTSDITRLSEIISWGLLDIFWGLFVMIGITIVMLVVNWKLALLVLMVVPLLAVASVYFQVRILKSYRQVRKENSKITSGFNEGITGAKTTKTLGLEERNYNEFTSYTSSMKASSLRAAKLSALFLPIALGLGYISVSAILVAGGQQVLVSSLEFGTLLLFSQYATQFFEPVRQIARLIAEFQMAQASAERIFTLIETENTIDDSKEIIQKFGSVCKPTKEIVDPIIGNIEFKDIEFYYNKEEPVLENFNLKVKAGQTVALVGQTGSGKSSIVNLLCRFYEPVNGEVLLDGVDYRERSVGWLHRQIGYVLQSPHLFSGTIKDNIKIGKIDATDEEVIEVCKIVNAHDFIMNFEKGYDTDVGEGGSKLSVGQKQLLSFARALLVNPAFFILDEATASIDTETERVVQYAIDHILKNKTSFIVAHRLSTIVNVDIIVVIEKGKIIEKGTHQELMELAGNYYQLYTNQFKEDVLKL